MSKFKWSEFGKIENVATLLQYLDGRQYSHTYYYHYTTLEAINGILDKRTFRISNVSRFNDRAELKTFSNPQYAFSLCFSTGLNENLPLWYLYAGLTGGGGRIGFTANAINHLIESSSFELFECDENNNPIDLLVELKNGISMNLKFQDVLYYGSKSQQKLDLKNNTMTNYLIPLSEKDDLERNYQGFLKSLIWYYEKETRLLIEIIGEATRMIVPERKYCVVMHFDEKTYKSVRLTFAPEVVDISTILKKHPSIRKYIFDTSKAAASMYQGEIEMNLCSRCSKYVNQKHENKINEEMQQ